MSATLNSRHTLAAAYAEFTNDTTADERLRAVQQRASEFEGVAADWAAKALAQKLAMGELTAVLNAIASINPDVPDAKNELIRCASLARGGLAKAESYSPA